MNLSQAKDLLLVQSIEQADPNGNVLSSSEILRAQNEAGPPAVKTLSDSGEHLITPETEGFLIRRAARLRETLIHEHALLSQAFEGSHWKKWAPLLILTAAFLLGAATNGLGRERTINILSFPMMGMVLWNLAVYAILLSRALLPGSGTRISPEDSAALIPAQPPRGGPLVRFVIWASGVRDRQSRISAEDSLRNTILARGTGRFLGDWMRSTSGLNVARGAVVLHLGATLFAIGAIAGMYAKALSFEYIAVWESTYLTKDSLHDLLRFFLGPASLVSGLELPSPEELEAFRHPNGDNAGKWLHLYAATAAIFIIIPRLILAAAEWLRMRQRANKIPLPPSSAIYLQDVLRGVYGEVQSVRVYSYSFVPGGRTRDRCKELAHALWGAKLDIEIADPVPYGGEDDLLESLTSDTVADHAIVLFNLAASPEHETHGRLVSGLRHLAAGSSKRRNSLLVLLDSTSFHNKFAELPEYDRRFDERRRTWERVLKEHQVQPVLLDNSTATEVHAIAQSCLRL